MNRGGAIGVINDFRVVSKKLLVGRRMLQPEKTDEGYEKRSNGQESQGGARDQGQCMGLEVTCWLLAISR